MSDRMVFRSSLSRLPWVLAPLGLTALVLGGLFAARSSPDAWAGLGIGSLFIVVATVFFLTRRELVIAGGRWRYARGLFHPPQAGEVAALSAVRLRLAAALGPDPEEAPEHLVELVPAEGEAIPVLELDDEGEATARAEALARRLRLPLEDARGGAEAVVRAPVELDRRVASRLLLGAGPEAPAPAGVRTAAGHLTLPAPGPRGPAGLAFLGASALLAFLVAAHALAFARAPSVGLRFVPFALPVDLAVLWLFGRAALAAFADEEIRWSADAVAVTRLLGPFRVRVLEVEVERLFLRDDGASVRLGAAEAPRPVGRGLPEDGRRWLVGRLRREVAARIAGPG